MEHGRGLSRIGCSYTKALRKVSVVPGQKLLLTGCWHVFEDMLVPALPCPGKRNFGIEH